jgi:Family of unknown function (DUF5681)
MPFEKGKSGNPGGQPKAKVWRDAIDRAVHRRAGKHDLKGIDNLADILLDCAMTGNIAAIKEFGDRLDGKPAQALEHSGSIGVTHEEALAALEHVGEDDAG